MQLADHGRALDGQKDQLRVADRFLSPYPYYRLSPFPPRHAVFSFALFIEQLFLQALQRIADGGSLLGHDGHGNAFAYYWPEKDVLFTGTLNQTKADWWPIVEEAIQLLA